LQVVGIDRSAAMLYEASALGSTNIVRGRAEDLPFADHSFDLVAIITALEFVADQARAVRETWRVSRHGLLLGVLNAESRLGRAYRRAGGPIWQAAQLLTVAELRRLVRQQLGTEVVIRWQTTLWPRWPAAAPLPWGGFIGMAVRPGPAEMRQ
jgi:ubiquinone/menaquinone biosynthesis C-methylase UbiE